MASSLAALNTCLRSWNSLGAFESNWWSKCLWDWCVCEPFLSMNTKKTIKNYFFQLKKKIERLQILILDHLQRKTIRQFCFGTLVQQNMTQRARGRKIFRIKAIVCFWTIKQKKIMTHVIKGRSDFSSGLTFPSEIKQEPHWFETFAWIWNVVLT